jgi:hypothetical protein
MRLVVLGKLKANSSSNPGATTSSKISNSVGVNTKTLWVVLNKICNVNHFFVGLIDSWVSLLYSVFRSKSKFDIENGTTGFDSISISEMELLRCRTINTITSVEKDQTTILDLVRSVNIELNVITCPIVFIRTNVHLVVVCGKWLTRQPSIVISCRCHCSHPSNEFCV